MKELSLERLETLLDCHGGDLRRWPPSERAAAERLLAGSAAARALKAQAEALDAALDDYAVAPPDPQLRARLVSAQAPRADRAGWLRELWRDLGGWRLAGPAFAASLALGAIAVAGAWVCALVPAAALFVYNGAIIGIAVLLAVAWSRAARRG